MTEKRGQPQETDAQQEHWRRIREQIEHEKHVEWLEKKIENLEALLNETVRELNGYRSQKTATRPNPPLDLKPMDFFEKGGP